MEFPRRTFDGEGVKADVDFGPTLMLNRNRCILCTRCIRFMSDIDGDAQIGVADRGYGSEISTFEERGVHSLLSGNLMDVCPVGAITTRDYRFKARPWDNPSAVDTICTLCEKGCNTTAWVKAKPEWAKGAQLARMTPRHNEDVNGYWMCDIGRFEYKWIESDQRLTRPLVKEAGKLANTTWDAAIAQAAAKLSGGRHGRFLLSAHASHEEMYLTARLAQHLLGDMAQQGIAVSWSSRVKEQPAARQLRRAAGRRAERGRRPRLRPRARLDRRRSRAAAICRRCATKSKRAASQPCMWSIRAPRARLATCAGSSRRANRASSRS